MADTDGNRIEAFFDATDGIQKALGDNVEFLPVGATLHIGDPETSGKQWRFKIERLPLKAEAEDGTE